MSTHDKLFKAGWIVNDLLREIGDSKFGYRAQSLFAHVLIGIGGKILEINAQGHPDITAVLGGKTLLIQVKSVHARSVRRSFTIGHDDLEGINPYNKASIGYLAVLDCTLPVSWILVEYSIIKRLFTRPISLVTLRSISNKIFSDECSEVFINLVLTHQKTLTNLTYNILRNRALQNGGMGRI